MGIAGDIIIIVVAAFIGGLVAQQFKQPLIIRIYSCRSSRGALNDRVGAIGKRSELGKLCELSNSLGCVV